MTPDEVLDFAQDHAVEYVDLRWTESGGRWQHATVPLTELSAARFSPEVGFPARALPAGGTLLPIQARLVPDGATALVDPFLQHPTLAMTCDVRTGAAFPGADDSRGIARRAEAYVAQSQHGDAVQVRCNLEFFVFDQACFEHGLHAGHYSVDSREGVWRRGRDEGDNLGTQIDLGRGTAPLPPHDSLHNLRGEMVAALEACDVRCLGHRHGPATGGHAVIALPAGDIVTTADRVMLARYVVRNVAARHGKVVTFMPQPLFGEYGSGMSTLLAVQRAGESVLVGRDGLTDVGRRAIGGLLRHARGLTALACPTTNSYKRLMGGRGVTTSLTYGAEGEGVLISAGSVTGPRPHGALAVRLPDASCNPYLTFSALLMAAIDGMESKAEPGPPTEGSEEDPELAGSAEDAGLPATLDEALTSLAADHRFLLRGEVFSGDLVRAWIERKRRTDVAALRARPHPHEFCLYFDV